jgi:hypothetical protein
VADDIGTDFDDMKADRKRNEAIAVKLTRLSQGVPAEVTDELMPFYLEVRERPHAKVFVKGPTVGIGIEALLEHWFERRWIPRKNAVWNDDKLKVTQVHVES